MMLQRPLRVEANTKTKMQDIPGIAAYFKGLVFFIDIKGI